MGLVKTNIGIIDVMHVAMKTMLLMKEDISIDHTNKKLGFIIHEQHSCEFVCEFVSQASVCSRSFRHSRGSRKRRVVGLWEIVRSA